MGLGVRKMSVLTCSLPGKTLDKFLTSPSLSSRTCEVEMTITAEFTLGGNEVCIIQSTWSLVSVVIFG